MAKPRRTPPAKSDAPERPAGRKPRPDTVHSSVYLPETVHEALRLAAFEARCKIHDIILEGIGLALRKRGYPAVDELKAKGERKGR